jgi:hypothetical protein
VVLIRVPGDRDALVRDRHRLPPSFNLTQAYTGKITASNKIGKITGRPQAWLRAGPLCLAARQFHLQSTLKSDNSWRYHASWPLTPIIASEIARNNLEKTDKLDWFLDNRAVIAIWLIFASRGRAG